MAIEIPPAVQIGHARLSQDLARIASEMIGTETDRHGPRFARPEPSDPYWEPAQKKFKARLEALREAESYYQEASEKSLVEAPRFEKYGYIKVRITPYDRDAISETSIDQTFFVGPLTSDDQFLNEINHQSLAVNVSFNFSTSRDIWKNLGPGAQWSVNAHSMDEKHSVYEYRVLSIYVPLG